MPPRPLSLATRSTLATIVVLVAFLGLTGVALDQAYYRTASSNLRDRLQGYVYALLASTDVTRGGRVLVPDTMPSADLLRPGSGLYATVNGGHGFHWESPSAIGRNLPLDMRREPGIPVFSGPIATDAGHVYAYTLRVVYDTPGSSGVELTFSVAQTESRFDQQLTVFRRTLLLWLSGLGLVLLILQWLLLRWSLSPLRRVAADLTRIEQGHEDGLPGAYPRELSGLTDGLNAFIHSEREHLERYRNTLSDLAHSLKTPLAVMRARLEETAGDDGANDELLAQVRRMDGLVGYQLSRAATSGKRTFAAPVAVMPHVQDVVQGLEKVHADRGVLCEFDVADEDCVFYGEEGDLMELLGNLLENAFKWSERRVLLSLEVLPSSNHGHTGLVISVADDGPGVDTEHVESVLQRGVRADERVQGHGIGLAVVQDIVKAYDADLQVARSEELGGALFCITFAADR